VVDYEAVLGHCLYHVAVVCPSAVFLWVYPVVAVVAGFFLFAAVACIPVLYHAAVCIFQVAHVIGNPDDADHPWVEPEQDSCRPQTKAESLPLYSKQFSSFSFPFPPMFITLLLILWK